MPTGLKSDYRSWNDQMAERYDVEEYLRTLPWPLRLMEEMRYRILAGHAARAGGLCLDAGCGSGRLLRQLVKRNVASVAMDLSGINVQRTRRALNGAALFQGDLLNLPLRSESLGSIACTEVIEHVTAPEHAIREMTRCLIPGGTLLVSVPNDGIIVRLRRTLDRIPGLVRLLGLHKGGPSRDGANEWHLHSFTRHEFEKMAASHCQVDRVISLPSRIFPLRWIFVARKV